MTRLKVSRKLVNISWLCVLEETDIWISRLSKDHLHQCGWTLFKLLRAQIKHRGGGQILSCVLSWNTHLLLPSDVSAWFLSPSSQPLQFLRSLALEQELHLSASLVLRSLDLSELHYPLTDSVMGLLRSLHNKPISIINFLSVCLPIISTYLSSYLSIPPIVSVSLKNSVIFCSRTSSSFPLS